MYPLKPQKYAIARCSLGVIGLITSETKQEITYNDSNKGFAWTGFVVKPTNINSIKKVFKEGNLWSSQNPEVLFKLDEKVIFGHYNDIDYKHLQFMISNYLNIENLVNEYNEKNKQFLTPKFLIDNGLQLDKELMTINFEKYQKIVNYERLNVHATHCHVYHGCKYGEDSCPVVNGQLFGIKTEEFSFDDYYIMKKELKKLDDTDFIEELRHNGEFQAIMRQLSERKISIRLLENKDFK